MVCAKPPKPWASLKPCRHQPGFQGACGTMCTPMIAGDICLERPCSTTSLGTDAEKIGRVLQQDCAFPCLVRWGAVLRANGVPWALL